MDVFRGVRTPWTLSTPLKVVLEEILEVLGPVLYEAEHFLRLTVSIDPPRTFGNLREGFAVLTGYSGATGRGRPLGSTGSTGSTGSYTVPGDCAGEFIGFFSL